MKLTHLTRSDRPSPRSGARLRTACAFVACLLAATVLAPIEPARAQAVLTPNQISGKVLFTNQNPEILRILDTENEGLRWGIVYGDSIGTETTLHHYVYPSTTNRMELPYELSVESSEEGIAYSMNARAYLGIYGNDIYLLRAGAICTR